MRSCAIGRGSLTLPSGRVAEFDISLATDDHADHSESPSVFSAADPVAPWLRESEQEAYLAVSRAMLETYNGGWSDEPPSPRRSSRAESSSSPSMYEATARA
jgi:hypothetical protein